MIQLTVAAANRINDLLASQPHAVGLHIGIKKTGCSGLSYVLNFVDRVDAELLLFITQGISVYVSLNDLSYVTGMTIDFVSQGLNQTFVFNNPNAKSICGCGESFRT